jgi:hypothetical protein
MIGELMKKGKAKRLTAATLADLRGLRQTYMIPCKQVGTKSRESTQPLYVTSLSLSRAEYRLMSEFIPPIYNYHHLLSPRKTRKYVSGKWLSLARAKITTV